MTSQRIGFFHMFMGEHIMSNDTGEEHADLENQSPYVGNSTMTEMAGPKDGSRRMFILCFLGIFVSYFVYGILQEKITQGQYGEGESAEKFTYTLTLVFVQCIINTIFAQLAIQWYRNERLPDNSPQKYYALMAFSYLGAMVASNQSLQYVSYPTQVLGKSAKPIPVMLLGVLMAQKRYPVQKYLFVLMIVMGVATFMYKDGKSNDAQEAGLGFGETLLLISLFLDGVTGGVQDKLRGEYRTNAHKMMFSMNLWSIFYLGVALIVSGEGVAFVEFATKYPWVLLNLISFSLCSAVGQNFVFLTVTKFGPLTCSIFTTTRKFFTILGSVLIFQNPISSRQWFGTFLVFVGLALDSVYGKSRKNAS